MAAVFFDQVPALGSKQTGLKINMELLVLKFHVTKQQLHCLIFPDRGERRSTNFPHTPASLGMMEKLPGLGRKELNHAHSALGVGLLHPFSLSHQPLLFSLLEPALALFFFLEGSVAGLWYQK